MRRAAAKAVAAVITHYPDLLPVVRTRGTGAAQGSPGREGARTQRVRLSPCCPCRASPGTATPGTSPLQIYPQVAPVLVQRFREREETVKQDVFQVWVVCGVEWGEAGRCVLAIVIAPSLSIHHCRTIPTLQSGLRGPAAPGGAGGAPLRRRRVGPAALRHPGRYPRRQQAAQAQEREDKGEWGRSGARGGWQDEPWCKPAPRATCACGTHNPRRWLPPTRTPLVHTTPCSHQVGVFRVLLELVAVAPDAVGAHVRELLPGIQAALQVRSAGHRGEWEAA